MQYDNINNFLQCLRNKSEILLKRKVSFYNIIKFLKVTEIFCDFLMFASKIKYLKYIINLLKEIMIILY